MIGIDESLTFKPVRIAVLTVSDTRTRDDDTSGDLLAGRIEAAGHSVAGREIVRDDIPALRHQLKLWIDDATVDAVVTTGGTGLPLRMAGTKSLVRSWIAVTVPAIWLSLCRA